MPLPQDECTNPTSGLLTRRDLREPRGTVLRQEVVTPGYTTKDDWGTDGDDSKHLGIPHYKTPGYFEGRAGFPKDGSDPAVVDVIFFDLYVLACLRDIKSRHAQLAGWLAGCCGS